MSALLNRLPFAVVLAGLGGLLMGIPAVFALITGEARAAATFGGSGAFIMVFAFLVGLARWGEPARPAAAGLLSLTVFVWTVLPLAFALPVAALGDLPLGRAWFEMVAAFTSTGATLFAEPESISPVLHLWRGLVGWCGGLLVLVAATAWLAPLRIGGFEMLDAGSAPQPLPRSARFERHRVKTALAFVLPWYGGLTLALWLGLAVTGLDGFDAFLIALATLSTSGILPASGLGPIGPIAEIMIFLALLATLSRSLLLPRSAQIWSEHPRGLRGYFNEELRLGIILVASLMVLVGLRSFIIEPPEGLEAELPALGQSLWAAAFTGLGFLSTTGFSNEAWNLGRAWSGIAAPSLVLMGLVLIGGGVATTAGGVKLARILAMAHLGRSELERMIHPDAIVASGGQAFLSVSPEQRVALRAGALSSARAAWLFTMVFAITAVILLASLLLTGLKLEEGLVFAIAALSTCGPLVEAVAASDLRWWGLSDPALFFAAMGMILGRVEILVIVALVLGRIRGD